MASVIKHSMVWGPKENITLGSGCVPRYLETILKKCMQPVLWSPLDLQGPIRIIKESIWLWQCKQFSITHWSWSMIQCEATIVLLGFSEDTQVQTYSQPNTNWNQNQSLKPLKGKRLTGEWSWGFPPNPPKNDHEILKIARSHFITNLFWTVCVTEKMDSLILSLCLQKYKLLYTNRKARMPASIGYLAWSPSLCRNKSTYKVIVAKQFQMTVWKTTSALNAKAVAQSMNAMEFRLDTGTANTMRHNNFLQKWYFISYQVKNECECLRTLRVG